MMAYQYALRRRMMRVIDTARLPKEYQEVEYIESTGTQHINTSFLNNQNTRIVMKAQATALSANAWLFGSRNASSASTVSLFYYTSNKLWTCDYAATSNRLSFSGVGSMDVLEIDYNKNVCAINGITVTQTAQAFTATQPMVLFAINVTGTVSGHIKAKLWSAQIYDNGTLIRDFVPCYRKADTAVGLYDLVNGVFYDNAGSGAFVKGADVGAPSLPPTGSNISFAYTGEFVDNRDANGIGTIRFISSGILNVLSGNATALVYMLAGGGGAALIDYAHEYWRTAPKAGGGGGGNLTTTILLTAGTYEIIIGKGGAPYNNQYTGSGSGTKGGNTIAFGQTVTGGEGGFVRSSDSTAIGGNAGSPNATAGKSSAATSAAISGGSPNGGGVTAGETTAAKAGDDGYVEITFS